MDDPTAGKLRALPQVQRLLEQAQPLLAGHARTAVVTALRRALDATRAAVLADPYGPAPEPAAILAAARALLDAPSGGMVRVINATGIVLHTNLGRAPLAAAAALAAAEAATGYSNLEYDLFAGHRGSRTQGIEPLLRAVTGAEAGLAVNNCAAAVLLALSALAGGGEVIVSRGELVEIGGGFRIPDVIQQGGARLVEVGTTNKTRLADYRHAITPQTRVLLRVHQSNFRLTGFTEATSLADLAALARERGLLLVHDLGSGALRPLGSPAEATVQQSVAAGVDVVAFSGDKLLGGPQSGLLVGRAPAIDALRRHPLLRAVRLDKLVLAALEATLRCYAEGRAAELPVLRMLAQDTPTLQSRAAALLARLDPALAAAADIEPSQGATGGGTLPDRVIPSHAVVLAVADPQLLAAALRAQRPAVVGRISGGRLWLDMLAVTDDELPALAAALNRATAT